MDPVFTLMIFFTKELTPHFLKFYLFYTVIPAAPQETVGEAGIEPGFEIGTCCTVYLY
jgi:hypothetical protein